MCCPGRACCRHGCAPHAFHGLGHEGQTDAGARNLVLSVQTLEHAEDAVVVLHVEALSVVGDAQVNLIVLLNGRDPDVRWPVGGRELQGVVQQVAQDHGQAPGVGHHQQAGCHLDSQTPLAPFDGFHHGLRHVLNQPLEIHGFHVPRHLFQPRIRQQIGDQLGHVKGGALDALQVVPPLGVQLTGVLLQQQRTEAFDAAQRCAKVVGCRVGEGFQFAVDRLQPLHAFLQLRGALGHLLFQLAGQFAEPAFGLGAHQRVDQHLGEQLQQGHFFFHPRMDLVHPVQADKAQAFLSHHEWQGGETSDVLALQEISQRAPGQLVLTDCP